MLLGSFRANVWWAAVAATGVVLAACYMLWMFQRVFFGPVTHEENRGLRDLTAARAAGVVPLLVLIFWIGVMPQPFLDRMQPSLDHMLGRRRGSAPR